jgi:hypothetical protein
MITKTHKDVLTRVIVEEILTSKKCLHVRLHGSNKNIFYIKFIFKLNNLTYYPDPSLVSKCALTEEITLKQDTLNNNRETENQITFKCFYWWLQI